MVGPQFETLTDGPADYWYNLENNTYVYILIDLCSVEATVIISASILSFYSPYICRGKPLIATYFFLLLFPPPLLTFRSVMFAADSLPSPCTIAMIISVFSSHIMRWAASDIVYHSQTHQCFPRGRALTSDFLLHTTRGKSQHCYLKINTAIFFTTYHQVIYYETVDIECYLNPHSELFLYKPLKPKGILKSSIKS